ncbi:hypothetical protein J6590_099672 [Homalodisca vitripennis]|nr:hypothetical protein J6590_099672 [Homalodisca vitripennis]
MSRCVGWQRRDGFQKPRHRFPVRNVNSPARQGGGDIAWRHSLARCAQQTAHIWQIVPSLVHSFIRSIESLCTFWYSGAVLRVGRPTDNHT